MKPNASPEARQAGPSSTIPLPPENSRDALQFAGGSRVSISRRLALFGGAVGALALVPAVARLHTARPASVVRMPVGSEILSVDIDDVPTHEPNDPDLPLESRPRAGQRYAFIDHTGAIRAGELAAGPLAGRQSYRTGWRLVANGATRATFAVTVLGAVVEA